MAQTVEERRSAQAAHHRSYYAANPEKYRARDAIRRVKERATRLDRERLRMTGWTRQRLDEYAVIQNNLCAICGDLMKVPHCDHDHTTNKPRGLLCGPCNSALGLLKERRMAVYGMAAYLDQYK